ncbi:Mu transposase C-terminal domain-containing protein [Pseudoflavonifractor capillosus]|nr:Mu transposase C-terminal domain-containing protein [Pseudoflavonifractor capillosus]
MSEALRFVKRLGAIYRVLIETPAGCWLINCNGPSPPFFEADLHRYERVPAPESWISEQINTPAQEARLQMIQPLLNCDKCISDKSQRYRMAAEAAQQHQTTTRRILRLYYRYLATGRLTQKRTQQASKSNQMIERAIRRYYFGAKRLSLRSAYEMMLLEDYVGPEGEMDSDAPTWSQFRHYYYGHGFHRDPQKIIAREGLTKYQRDHRPAWGSSAGWRSQPGSYQMDATQADIYLVSRQDRSIVVGRPYIYLAVDTATHLIAGVYVGYSCDETAVMACIAQAASDKVEYCARYGIEITQEQWPSVGMPTEIITDQGREFFGPRMSEMCRRYGLEVLTLPPFRPDFKGTVEKSIDLLQQRYKPMLRGRGVIEEGAQERWATDYRTQATLDLDDFTRIVIHSILYLNSGRILDDKTPAERWLELSPRLMAVNPQELHIQTLPRDTAKLTRKGIRVNRMWYAPDDADGLTIGNVYTIAYDPSDLRCIHMILADRICPCHAVEIGQPVSVCEVDAVHEAAKKSRGVARAKETASSIATTQAIRSIVEYADKHRETIREVNGEQIKQEQMRERGRLT